MIIYLITNLINGKIYVGQDSKDNPRYLGSGVLIDRAKEKYGKKNFRKKTLQRCSTKKELNDRERFWIKELRSNDLEIGYNLTEGGEGTLGWIPAKEQNRKHSEWMKKNNPMKGRIGMFSPHFGVKDSEETLRRKSESAEGSHCGEDNGMYGKHHSKKTLEKWSKDRSGERNPMYGKTGELCPNYGEKNGRAIAVKINGVDYPAIAEADRELNIGYDKLRGWLQKEKEGYEYAEEKGSK